MSKRKNNIKDIILSIIMGISLIVSLFVVMTLLVKMGCYGEQSGAQIVIGGNSYRCR